MSPLAFSLVGAVESRLNVTERRGRAADALGALQVTVVRPVGATRPDAQPVCVEATVCGSATVQVTVTGAVYQPLAPFGAAGLSAPLTVGGVASSDGTIRSAMMKPEPQSVAGCRRGAGLSASSGRS